MPTESKIKRINVEYPETEKSDHVEEFWGEKLPDPYRWLEDDYAEETKAWVASQNGVTFGYPEQVLFLESALKKIPSQVGLEYN